MSNLVQTNSFPTAQEFHTMKELGKMAVGSGFLPNSIKTPEQAVVIMLKGRELGIPPMQAFSDIAVINGKPAMSASLMVALGYKAIPGLILNYLTTTNEVCELEIKRPGGKLTTFKFTMEDAKRAGLAGKGPWATYPAAMLRARCTSAAARAMFPDALSGVVYTPEELGAEVDDDGNVLDVTPGAAKEPTPQIDEIKNAVPEVFLDDENEYDPGEVVCTLPKYNNTKIKDIGEIPLSNYIDYFKRKGNMSPSVEIFVGHAEAYLKLHEFTRGERAAK